MSVGLVGAMRVFPLGLRASQRAEMSSRAAIVAQRTIEALKLTPWDELSAGQTLGEEDGFEVATRIHTPNVDGLADPTQLKEVVVTVRWDQSGRSRQLVFVTHLWQPPS